MSRSYIKKDIVTNLDVINFGRKSNGMHILEKERVSCLKCDVKFETYHKRTNRICHECDKKRELSRTALFENFD